ncbi:Alpha/Beta hydrolase protein [Exophiala viscosa]|uniref:Alpha/Beta hydrolase protein n=1 Tax=Exophiala viscosa TaxID=2486360 RepID=A0AAN6E3D9_9EURO|nr:Alpha/Beta hydrolase protein [Exophiala viscosa]KAI1629292.1 Alpha/Beta hydrolase protein [Exophiala viscosa]
MEGFIQTGSAYAQEHGTRPATIGFVLASNPLALLAWIGEKFIQWTDETPFLEDILDDVTLYWFTQSFPRCIYIYREYHGDPGAHTPHGDPRFRSEKPVGYSWFPQELAPIPKAWVERMGNLVWHRQHDSGGHFAALEKPEVLMADVEDFAKQVWQRKISLPGWSSSVNNNDV